MKPFVWLGWSLLVSQGLAARTPASSRDTGVEVRIDERLVEKLAPEDSGWRLEHEGKAEMLSKAVGDDLFFSLRETVLEIAADLRDRPDPSACEGSQAKIELSGIPHKQLELCLAKSRDKAWFDKITNTR